MKVTGIHHVAIKACGVEDYNKTVNFYHNILGMPIFRQWGDGIESGALIDTGAGMMEVFANGEDYPGQGSMRHIAFEVDDVDGYTEAARNAGYAITMEPTDIVIAGDYPARIAFCIGPVGEEVEFFKVL